MSGFRRLVLELGHGAADPATMRAAATLARLLDTDLHALFVEDEALLHASTFHFAREINVVSRQWRPLEANRLEADLRAAANRARQLLTEVARVAGVRQDFEIRRGDVAVQVEEFCVATDIVMLSVPRHPGGGMAAGFQRLRDTAHRSAASILFMPGAPVPLRGQIVVVASGPDDPALIAARRIADRGHERLAILRPVEVADWGEGARPLAGTSVHDVAAALNDVRERLIVIARDAASNGAALFEARGVPVLVVG
jgi:hypothetical protein